MWLTIRKELKTWRIGSLPGLLAIALIILARATGNLQFWEWAALDYLLRLRPPEPTDERIVIVGITEEDIRKAGVYPIPDGQLAALIRTIQRYQPTAIGLDIFRDLPVEPGHAELVAIFQRSQQLVGIEKALPDQFGATVDAAPSLPPDRVGFADVVLDADGLVRRSLLGTYDATGQYKFSLTLRLADLYLSSKKIPLQNGIRDPTAMRFHHTELTRLTSTSGSYVGVDARGNQILLNVRSGRTPFRTVSMADVLAGRVPPSWMRDRIVLVGVTAISAKDLINSAAIRRSDAEVIYGVEIQAHAISQIISAVLDQRPLLQGWFDLWEYAWIVGWGLVGIGVGKRILSPFKLLLGLGTVTLLFVALCYLLVIAGWWVPVAPPLLVLIPNGIIAFLFYQRDRDLRARIQERQQIIDKIFDAIHNGPLQTLSKLLSHAQEQPLLSGPLTPELKRLDKELRIVYDSVRQEALNQGNLLYLSSGLALDLHHPVHEMLYEIYSNTLARDFPCFQAIKLNITTFQEIDSRSLNIEQKRGLCRFLEEALCNVGKHAIGATRLEVVCKHEYGQNLIRVTDNGLGINLSSGLSRFEGQGTRQAKKLARQIAGRFRRSPASSRGTVCELTWPVAKPWFKG